MSGLQSSTLTRAFLTSESHDQNPTIRLISNSIFRDYYIRCLCPSSHYQQHGILFSGHYHRPRRCHHHQLRPSGNYFTDFCSHRADRPAASNRLTATRLRRHRTVNADQLGNISQTSAATAPVDLLLQSATNRPWRHHHRRLLRAFSTAYSGNHAVILAA